MNIGRLITVSVVVLGTITVMSSHNQPAPAAKAAAASTARAAVSTSAEEDLRTGDISIKNGISGECGKQVLQHRATADCEQEAKRWSDELQTKLNNPQWRARFERKLDEIIR